MASSSLQAQPQSMIRFGCQQKAGLRDDPNYVFQQARESTRGLEYIMSNRMYPNTPLADMVWTGTPQRHVGGDNIVNHSNLRAIPSGVGKNKRTVTHAFIHQGVKAHSRAPPQVCMEHMMRAAPSVRPGRMPIESTQFVNRWRDVPRLPLVVEPDLIHKPIHTQAAWQNEVQCHLKKHGRLHA